MTSVTIGAKRLVLLSGTCKRGEPTVREPDGTLPRPGRAYDRQALADIYDEYHELIYRYVYRRVGDIDTARDLTADVFRSFLGAAHCGRCPNRSLRAWFYRSAHNAVIDYYRRQKHRRHASLEFVVLASEEDPIQTTEKEIMADAVRVALNELTADQQQVVALKFLEGLTNDEVSEVMEKSVGAVKSLQHRALASLRRHLIPVEERGDL